MSLDEGNSATINTFTEDLEMLEEVLSLPEKYRIPIYLFYYEGYQTDEIVKILKKNHQTVRTQLARARSLLKKSIGGMEYG
jgi:DNA-directed RNA polymerase specialized sigma24 family protein